MSHNASPPNECVPQLPGLVPHQAYEKKKAAYLGIVLAGRALRHQRCIFLRSLVFWTFQLLISGLVVPGSSVDLSSCPSRLQSSRVLGGPNPNQAYSKGDPKATRTGRLAMSVMGAGGGENRKGLVRELRGRARRTIRGRSIQG